MNFLHETMNKGRVESRHCTYRPSLNRMRLSDVLHRSPSCHPGTPKSMKGSRPARCFLLPALCFPLLFRADMRLCPTRCCWRLVQAAFLVKSPVAKIGITTFLTHALCRQRRCARSRSSTWFFTCSSHPAFGHLWRSKHDDAATREVCQ